MAEEMNGSQPQNVDLSKQKIDKMLKDHHNFRKVLVLFIILILIALIGTWFYNAADRNSYDIMVSGNLGSLQLSFDPSFEKGYTVIKAKGRDKMLDDKGGTLSDIQGDIDDVISGKKQMEVLNKGQKGGLPGNSDEFSVAKLYLRNSAKLNESVTYKLKLETYNINRNAFAAARVMVCRQEADGSWNKKVYAQPGADGAGEPVACQKRDSTENMKDENGNVWVCNNFKEAQNGEWYYDSKEFDNITFTLKPMETVTYVIAVWYEGSDVDHNDKIVGGSYSLQVSFEAV